MTEAYLLKRQESLDVTRDKMVKGYQDQRDPVAKNLDELVKQINAMPSGPGRDAAYSSKTDLQSKVNTLNSNIAKLQALDMTPGRVTSAATPPSGTDGPGIPMSLALGAAVGLALGLLAAWVRLVFDPAPRSEGDVAQALRAPYWATCRGPRPAAGRCSRPVRKTPASPRSSARWPSGSPTTPGSPTGAGCWSSPRGAAARPPPPRP